MLLDNKHDCLPSWRSGYIIADFTREAQRAEESEEGWLWGDNGILTPLYSEDMVSVWLYTSTVRITASIQWQDQMTKLIRLICGRWCSSVIIFEVTWKLLIISISLSFHLSICPSADSCRSCHLMNEEAVMWCVSWCDPHWYSGRRTGGRCFPPTSERQTKAATTREAWLSELGFGFLMAVYILQLKANTF